MTRQYVSPKYAYNNRGNAKAWASEAITDYDEATLSTQVISKPIRIGHLLKLQKYQDAISDCDKAIIEPRYADPYHIRGDAKIGLGKGKQLQTMTRRYASILKMPRPITIGAVPGLSLVSTVRRLKISKRRYASIQHMQMPKSIWSRHRLWHRSRGQLLSLHS